MKGREEADKERLIKVGLLGAQENMHQRKKVQGRGVWERGVNRGWVARAGDGRQGRGRGRAVPQPGSRSGSSGITFSALGYSASDPARRVDLTPPLPPHLLPPPLTHTRTQSHLPSLLNHIYVFFLSPSATTPGLTTASSASLSTVSCLPPASSWTRARTSTSDASMTESVPRVSIYRQIEKESERGRERVGWLDIKKKESTFN